MKKYLYMTVMALGVMMMTGCCPIRMALYDTMSDYNQYESAGVDVGYIPYIPPYHYNRSYYYPQRRYYRAPSRRYYRR